MEVTPLSDRAAYGSLRKWNAVAGLAHAVQAALILLLAADVSLGVTATWMEGPPGSGDAASEELFGLPFREAVALFLALAALDHLLVVAPGLAGRYERNLARGVNPVRWWEYSVSASLMVVLIAMLTGISEITALIALFGVNAAMILFGLAMEHANRPGAPVDWRPFYYGCVAGAVPWIAIGFQLVKAEQEADVPTFVFGIFVSLFLLFNSFAVNMALQYRGVGRWRSYLWGERMYIVLSLTAKSALAWQVYAGALAG